jgi:diketogulonate reductase-like aldo/keto reductase
VEEACRKSLSELGLEFIDLYIMHWPIAGNKGPTVEPPLAQTWRDMERLVDLGLVRAIGVSNFSVAKLHGLLPHATKPISVLQVESHPYWRNDELADFCAANDIHFSAYSALVRCLYDADLHSSAVLTPASRRARATARGIQLRTRRRKS